MANYWFSAISEQYRCQPAVPRQARRMSAWLCGIYLHFCIRNRHVVPCDKSAMRKKLDIVWPSFGDCFHAAGVALVSAHAQENSANRDMALFVTQNLSKFARHRQKARCFARPQS